MFFAGNLNRKLRLSALLSLLTFLFSPFEFASAITLPSGFQEEVVFQGLTNPTVIRFAPDGRIFVAEKSGRIKVFTSLTDTTSDLFVDLSVNVHNFWDRGLLGMAIDPDFPAQPYIYVLYTYDYDPSFAGPQPPRWGDTCPSPPGATADGCVVNARISRLEIAADNTLVGSEQVLLENNWCQQYPSHSIGSLQFGQEGALYASAGDGASFNFADYGQDGNPLNPCGDPPTGVGGTQTIPTAEGGALRSQDLRTSGDSVTYDGSVLRIDPDTGAAWPDNPLIGGDPEDDRIIAYGLRNPFRFAPRPGTNELWIGDVGWNVFEEINRITNPLVVTNFGWPCYEGSGQQGGYSTLNICINLVASGSATTPFYAYNHNADVTPGGDGCRPNPPGSGTSSSIAGIAFHMQGTYPASYNGALFFADYSRDCIYAMFPAVDGVPDVTTRFAFGVNADNPVHLEIGPGGDLFYADFDLGRIRRIKFNATNNPPTAVIDADPTFGNPPLFVQFDGSGSTDPDPGATLFYEWDLDGDGQYDDATIVDPVFTYSDTGSPYQVTVRLRVTDDDLAQDTETVQITVGNTPPTASIESPDSSLTWKVGDVIAFAGSATDLQDGDLAASSMNWDVIMHHCPGGTGDCHEHTIENFNGVSGGDFTAPDHEWYAFLEFRLTVTDSGGLTDQKSVSIDPQVVSLTYQSVPSGLSISVGGVAENTPFTRSAIIGSLNTIAAPSPQSSGSDQYYWTSWSDSGAQSHEILAGETAATYTATYSLCLSSDISCDGVDDDCDGTPDDDYVSVETSCGIGGCSNTGATSCVNGEVEDSCTPGNPAPDDSSCNGVDDNCNGANDEDYISVPTACGVGACVSSGATSCVNGNVQDSCTPGSPSPDDATCNGVDDDCNGTNDEDYVSVVTNCGIGACGANGATSCVNGGVQDSCIPGIPAPNDSTCNNIDDDCDGPIDEEVPSVNIAPSAQAFTAFGGTGSFDITVPPGACNWTAVSQEPWITITSGSGGDSDDTVQFDVGLNSGPLRTGNILVNDQTFVVTQDSTQTSIIFLDDFEDNDMADWTQIKPSWSVVSGKVQGSANRMGYAKSPDFGKCSICVFETDIILINANTRASLLAWHADKKNLVELRLLADKNKIDLRQISAGKTIQRKKFRQTLELNRSYHLRVVYDGTKVRAYLDQALIMEFTTSKTPNGNVGYRVKSVNGTAIFTAGQILIY
jgi:glucose/arabinose dehydrogenase